MFDFTKFPRQDLPFQISRREFLSALILEAEVFSGRLDGGKPASLAKLGSMPDALLAWVVPTTNPDFQQYVDQDYVWSRGVRSKETLKLFPAEPEATLALSLFDGRATLGEIGAALSQKMEWEEATGFAYVRGLFLFLVFHLIYVPRDPPD